MARKKSIPVRWAGNKRVARSIPSGGYFEYHIKWDWVAATDPIRYRGRVFLTPRERIAVPMTPVRNYKRELPVPVVWGV